MPEYDGTCKDVAAGAGGACLRCVIADSHNVGHVPDAL